jgi:ribonucleotide reductase alpha subunit
MDNLFIAQNLETKTPTVDFKTSGELLIEGRSVSENPVEFFEPIINWVNNLKKNHPPKINFTFKLEYFNTSTSKIILHLFRILESFHKNGTEVKIIWFYDKIDEDLREAGKDYQSILKIPFEFKEY